MKQCITKWMPDQRLGGIAKKKIAKSYKGQGNVVNHKRQRTEEEYYFRMFVIFRSCSFDRTYVYLYEEI